jgi:hypothetical protein
LTVFQSLWASISSTPGALARYIGAHGLWETVKAEYEVVSRNASSTRIFV